MFLCALSGAMLWIFRPGPDFHRPQSLSECNSQAHLNVARSGFLATLRSSDPSERGIGNAGCIGEYLGVGNLRVEVIEQVRERGLVAQSHTFVELDLLADGCRESGSARPMQLPDAAVAETANVVSRQGERRYVEILTDAWVGKVGIYAGDAIRSLKHPCTALCRVCSRRIGASESRRQKWT